MNASQYPVTLKYGATTSPYSPTKPHRGRDYGCPSKTPVVVAGQQIGLSGETGYVIGAHLHVQEWITGYANTREPNNAFQGGTVVNIDPNGTQGDGSFGKFITIRTADGWMDTYCHLSRIDVQIGQVIGANNMTQAEAEKVVTYFYLLGTGDYPNPGQADYWVPRVKDNPTAIDELGNAMVQTLAPRLDTVSAATDVDILRIIFSEIQGVDFNDVHTGKYDKTLLDTFSNQSFKTVVRNMFPNPDSTAYRQAKQKAFANQGDSNYEVATVYVKKEKK